MGERHKFHRNAIRETNRFLKRNLHPIIARRIFKANYTPDGNFHAVGIDGKYFTSGQLDAEQLERAIRVYGIQTVVNTRGTKPKSNWYEEEVEVCEDLGARLHSCKLRLEEPGKGLRELLIIGESALRPILYHCTGGRDRSRIAAISQQLATEGWTAAQAIEEMTRHGHKFSEYDGLLADYEKNAEPNGTSWVEFIQTYNEDLTSDGETETIEN